MYSPWGHKESDMTEWLSLSLWHKSQGSSSDLQKACLTRPLSDFTSYFSFPCSLYSGHHRSLLCVSQTFQVHLSRGLCAGGSLYCTDEIHWVYTLPHFLQVSTQMLSYEKQVYPPIVGLLLPRLLECMLLEKREFFACFSHCCIPKFLEQGLICSGCSINICWKKAKRFQTLLLYS